MRGLKRIAEADPNGKRPTVYELDKLVQIFSSILHERPNMSPSKAANEAKEVLKALTFIGAGQQE